MEAINDVTQRTGQPDLRGWKAIASALGLSERAARSAADAGHQDPLPVYLWGTKIVAYRHEIDAWVARQLRPRARVA